VNWLPKGLKARRGRCPRTYPCISCSCSSPCSSFSSSSEPSSSSTSRRQKQCAAATYPGDALDHPHFGVSACRTLSLSLCRWIGWVWGGVSGVLIKERGKGPWGESARRAEEGSARRAHGTAARDPKHQKLSKATQF